MDYWQSLVEEKKEELRFLYPDLEEDVINDIEQLAERLAGSFGAYPAGVPGAMEAIISAMIGWTHG